MELKHIKTFESYSSVDDSELIEEGVGKKLVSQIEGLDKSNLEGVKKFFLKFFGKAARQTTMASNLWKRVKAKVGNFKLEDLVKALESAKSDFEKSGKVGYVGLGANGNLAYKLADKVKIKSQFAGGGTDGDPSGGSSGA